MSNAHPCPRSTWSKKKNPKTNPEAAMRRSPGPSPLPRRRGAQPPRPLPARRQGRDRGPAPRLPAAAAEEPQRRRLRRSSRCSRHQLGVLGPLLERPRAELHGCVTRVTGWHVRAVLCGPRIVHGAGERRQAARALGVCARATATATAPPCRPPAPLCRSALVPAVPHTALCRPRASPWARRAAPPRCSRLHATTAGACLTPA